MDLRDYRFRFEQNDLLGGIVELAVTDLRELEFHSVTDDGPRIEGPTGWTCTTWVLRVMLTLEDMAIFDIPGNLMREMMCDITGEGYRRHRDLFPSSSLVLTSMVYILGNALFQ
ncbi:hypothetical protein DFS33DRAFT_1272331 [Desarmillaria ectypa]|nr:hypothetical protein DFS33DRAFT_1272331 [Desarmillaria ectypa]